MVGIVLAGGKGTRLRSVVNDLPKPMAPVNGRPFLEYVLDGLSSLGVTSFILAVGYKAESVMAHFGHEYRGLPVLYSLEAEPLGTGGAIREAMCLAQSKQVIVTNGDSLLRPATQLRLELPTGVSGLLVLHPMSNFDRYGTVDTSSDGTVIRFVEKQPTVSGNINTGIYVLPSSLRESFPLSGSFSFEEFLSHSCRTNRYLAVCAEGYFIDIGIPEDYARAATDLDGHQ